MSIKPCLLFLIDKIISVCSIYLKCLRLFTVLKSIREYFAVNTINFCSVHLSWGSWFTWSACHLLQCFTRQVCLSSVAAEEYLCFRSCVTLRPVCVKWCPWSASFSPRAVTEQLWLLCQEQSRHSAVCAGDSGADLCLLQHFWPLDLWCSSIFVITLALLDRRERECCFLLCLQILFTLQCSMSVWSMQNAPDMLQPVHLVFPPDFDWQARRVLPAQGLIEGEITLYSHK